MSMNRPFSNPTRRRALLMGVAVVSSPSIYFLGKKQWDSYANSTRLAQELEDEKKALDAKLLAQLQTKLDHALRQASSHDKKTVQSARKQLVKELAKLRKKALAKVSDVANKSSRFGECVKITGLLATDLINGSAKVAEHSARRLAPISQILDRMNTSSYSSAHKTCHQINAHSTAVASQWLSELSQMSKLPSADSAYIEDIQKKLNHTLAEQQLDLGVSASLLPLDIILASHFTKVLYRTLKKYAQRAAGVAGANVALSVADGPLPIGEVIALLLDAGFITWSAWSLYKACKKIDPRIRRALEKAIKQAEQDTLKHFDRKLSQLLHEAQQKRNTLLKRDLTTPQAQH